MSMFLTFGATIIAMMILACFHSIKLCVHSWILGKSFHHSSSFKRGWLFQMMERWRYELVCPLFHFCSYYGHNISDVSILVSPPFLFLNKSCMCSALYCGVVSQTFFGWGVTGVLRWPTMMQRRKTRGAARGDALGTHACIMALLHIEGGGKQSEWSRWASEGDELLKEQ